MVKRVVACRPQLHACKLDVATLHCFECASILEVAQHHCVELNGVVGCLYQQRHRTPL